MRKVLFMFLLFFTLTSANEEPRPIYIVKKEPAPPRQDKMFIVTPEKNNEFSKEIGEQLKYYNLINKELDSLPQWIK